MQTKSELCRMHPPKPCCRLAELYGVMLFSPAFGHRGVRMAAAQHAQMRRVAMLLEQALHITAQPAHVGNKWVIDIADERTLRQIMHGLGYDYKSHLIYHLNRNMVESDCCAAAFLRGAFLASGSLAGPDKKAHLELTTPHATLCREVVSLMLDHGLHPKTTERRGSHMIYWKDSATIGDFLTTIGAHRAMTALLEGKVERQMRAEINRQVICEVANISRVTDASVRQVTAIEQALMVGGIAVFPEKLHQTIDLRMANPTASLTELAAMFDPPISKPGLNHRLKRMVEIATKVTKNE